MFATDDTIVAIATPPGHAGIGVVRLSGPEALAVATRLLDPAPSAPRHATLATFRSTDSTHRRRAVDQVVATWFPAPRSYTGDAVVEISAHGSPVLLESILRAATRSGARLARPGEFTLRAYVNGKIDLVQAEAVADLVDAVTPAQARIAFDQLDGSLSRALAELASAIFDVRVRLEASLDFPDEGYHFGDADTLRDELEGLHSRVDGLLAASERGRLIREGRTIAIIGPTNAGKSSLFNQLLQAERAIVTAEPGTTRDLLSERVELRGMPVTLVDTAGFRGTAGAVEREGMSRARAAAGTSALRIVVLDLSAPFDDQWETVRECASPRVVVANKSDLEARWSPAAVGLSDAVVVSAMVGEGLEKLQQAIEDALNAGEALTDDAAVANVRQAALLDVFGSHLAEATRRLEEHAPEEVVLAALHDAERTLDEIVGRRTSDDVLEAIFKRFCIGK